MLTFTCSVCGVFMQATDRETLVWGIESHTCGYARSALEQQVIDWLVCCYGVPFWWFVEGASPLVVA